MKVKIRIEDYKVEELKSVEGKLLLDHNRIYRISDLQFETEVKKYLFGLNKVQETYITNIMLSVFSPVKNSIVNLEDWSSIESFINYHDFIELHEAWKVLENDLDAFGFDVIDREARRRYEENLQYMVDAEVRSINNFVNLNQ